MWTSWARASPQLSASGGRLVALSTAFAKSGWFYREWMERAGFKKSSITARECPRHTAEFLEREKRSMGERWFGMAYLNEFGDDIAAVFSTDDIRRAMSDDVLPLFPPAPLTAAVMATDYGDPAVKPRFGGSAA